jgi:hypothetical protein
VYDNWRAMRRQIQDPEEMPEASEFKFREYRVIVSRVMLSAVELLSYANRLSRRRIQVFLLFQ